MADFDATIDKLKAIFQSAPNLNSKMTFDAWRSDCELRAAAVTLYRKYAEGEHRAKLSAGMKKLLRLDDSDVKDGVSPFNINHMNNIIRTLVDRLHLTAINADTTAGSKWVAELLKRNRFDGLQIRIHDSASRDADAFLMVAPDTETGMPVFVRESAYDGTEGIIPIYSGRDRRIAAAVKIWRENITTEGKLTEQARINVYYKDRIEKFTTAVGSGALVKHYDQPGDPWPIPWQTTTGKPLGVPIFHFANQATEDDSFGKAEIADAIPVQDALNRILTSMVATSELGGFGINWAIGAKPPAHVEPGMWIYAVPTKTDGTPETTLPNEQQIKWLNTVKYGKLEASPIQPFIDELLFLIDQMYEITGTPRSASKDSTASGESLKQQESSLLGKARRAQINFGNVWEDAVMMAHAIQTEFAEETPPAIESVSADWAPAEVRDDATIIDNVVKIKDDIDERTKLEEYAKVFGWDADKIDSIMKAKKAEQTERLSTLRDSGLPDFQGNGFDTTQQLPAGDQPENIMGGSDQPQTAQRVAEAAG